VRRLETFPESGRIVPELATETYREIVVSPYRVVYRYRAERNWVRVLAVIHGNRTLPPISEAE
jgi:toxin ParE1/3/4